MNFHNRFRELLNEYKEDHPQTTQAQIAATLGLTPQAFSYYLKGREPNYTTLIKLSDFFNVSVDYLIGKSDYKNATQKLNAQSLGLSTLAALQLSALQSVDEELVKEGVEPLYNVIESLNTILTNNIASTFFQNLNNFFNINKCKQINEAVFTACLDPNSEFNCSMSADFDSKYIYLNGIQNALNKIREDLDDSSYTKEDDIDWNILDN